MKNNKTIILIFLILLVTIGAVMVLRPHPQPPVKVNLVDVAPEKHVLIYFSKNKGSEIVTEPVMRDMPDPKPKNSEEMLSFAFTELLKGPTEKEKHSGFFSEIPAGTKLLSVKETQDKIYVDFSEAYSSDGGSNSMVQRLTEVVKTAVNVHQKKPVYLKVSGKQLEVLGGEGLAIHQPITDDPSLRQ
jgi:spore germination protein GerM